MVIATAFLKQPRLLLSAPTKVSFLLNPNVSNKGHPFLFFGFGQEPSLAAFRFLSSGTRPEAMEDLTLKKCVACNAKDLRPMTRQSAQELLPKVEGWSMVEESGTLKLHRSWKVKTFTKGLEFFQLVADVAETEGHHPDLQLERWNNVKIDIWTHSVGGLTENDFILAAKISSLDLEGLLRKKAPTK